MENDQERKPTIISFNKLVVVFAISLLAGTSTTIAISKNAESKSEKTSNHSLPIKEPVTISNPPPTALIPMPIGEIGPASIKVQSTRNPFQEPSIIETNKLDVLNSVMQFSGIAKSGNELVAMIKTAEGQKAYKVGDSIGNGFIVKSISSTNVTVDISNGSRNYRLSLKGIHK